MSEKYLEGLNKIISNQVNQMDNTFVYGENINRGSFMSGLSKNVAESGSRVVKNVGNCEYTHIGIGFGLMMSGVNAVLFVKQLDFMMLGIDHFVSTYGSIRATNYQSKLGSFSIVTAMYDQGYQGPQSSFRGIGEMCSMSAIPAFLLNGYSDTALVVKDEMERPGVRFLVLSQKKANERLNTLAIERIAPDKSVIQYSYGSDATIACFGFSLSSGEVLQSHLSDRKIVASLFSVNIVDHPQWGIAIAEATNSKKLFVLDDTFSPTSSSFRFIVDVLERDPNVRFVIERKREQVSTAVSNEDLEVGFGRLIEKLF